jgi:hypothetical protein
MVCVMHRLPALLIRLGYTFPKQVEPIPYGREHFVELLAFLHYSAAVPIQLGAKTTVVRKKCCLPD